MPSVFTVAAPSADPGPLVFDSPHSGMEWPADFQPAASRDHILTTWDAFVDELWADVPASGGVLIAARFPRAYVDVNRADDDIDLELIEDGWPAAVRVSDYTRRGMGLIRRYALPGVPMYERKLTAAEVAARLDTYYHPYRAELRARIEAARAAHGFVCHVNCHSMKSRGNEMNVDAGELRPDFVISDRDGRTADPSLTQWAAGFFTGRGYTAQVNEPYKGGDLVRSFGDPAARCHSLQIEINRAIYMDEARFEKHAGFECVRADLAAFVEALRQRVTP